MSTGKKKAKATTAQERQRQKAREARKAEERAQEERAEVAQAEAEAAEKRAAAERALAEAKAAEERAAAARAAAQEPEAESEPASEEGDGQHDEPTVVKATEEPSSEAQPARKDSSPAKKGPAPKKDEKYHVSSGKSMWEKTDKGDLIISDDPLKGQAPKTAKQVKAERKRLKRRTERLLQKYGLQGMHEYKEPRPISVSTRAWTLVLSLSLSAIWVIAFNALYETMLEPLPMVGLALLFFASLFSMLVVRGYIESQRRYDVRPSTKTIHFYLQMLHYDARWWFLITFGIYATMWFLEHFLPISGTLMDAIYLASSAYLGYIWTVKYKGVDSVPFAYMETIFCFVAMLSNYIALILLR